MTTNREWLYSLDVADLADWFDAEHVETEERALDGDTAAQDGDSRELLEADVRKIAEAYNMDTQRHGTERFAHELYYSIIHLLDRQAAITERKLDAEFEAACNSCATKIDLREEVDELTAERDNWKEHSRTIEYRCKKAETDCEIYRKKFGKCLDYADAIHALMDDEGMA